MRANSKSSLSTLGSKLNEELSFELRTLLNGFLGPIQLLKRKVDDPDLVDIFRLLDSSLSRLERFTLRSALVKQMESDSFSIKKLPLNIVDIARYSILELQTISDLENVSLAVASEPSSINLIGDYNLMLEIFVILLETTISFSAQDSSIEIDFDDYETEVVCTIVSKTATFAQELNLSIEDITPADEVSWNLVLAKKIAMLHDAKIGLANNDGLQNSIEIKFNKTAV